MRRYDDDRTTKVTVADGKVEVHATAATGGANLVPNSTQRVILTVGDQAGVTGNTVTLAHGVDIATEHGWVGGQLHFNAVPLRDVLADVHRLYNMDLRAADSVGERRVTITVGSNSPDSLVEILAGISGTRAVRSGNMILFTKG